MLLDFWLHWLISCPGLQSDTTSVVFFDLGIIHYIGRVLPASQ